MIRKLALAILCLSAPAQAQSAYADLAEVDQAVARFTGAPLGAPGGAAAPVDRRLRLNPCRVPLALGWFGVRREAVQVSCPVPGGWRLFVPLTTGSEGAAASLAIAKGDAVTITVAGDGFAVAQPGEAIEGGPVGAWIRVRGTGTQAPVLRGRVIRPGLVGIDLP